MHAVSERLVLASLFVVAACGPKPPPAAAVAVTTAAPVAAPALAPPKTLAADTSATTPAGATYEAPKGWSLQTTPYGMQLVGPEKDVTLSIVELKNEPDANVAVAKAWKQLGPAQKTWPVRQSNPQLATDN